jgi:hypothetical protein
MPGLLVSIAACTTFAKSTCSVRSSSRSRVMRLHVQKVVYEPGELLHLTVDHAARPLKLGRARLRHLQDLNGVPDRRQRIAQLVRKHRDEFILATVGVA